MNFGWRFVEGFCAREEGEGVAEDVCGVCHCTRLVGDKMKGRTFHGVTTLTSALTDPSCLTLT